MYVQQKKRALIRHYFPFGFLETGSSRGSEAGRFVAGAGDAKRGERRTNEDSAAGD
jgi:hypothetical protein